LRTALEVVFAIALVVISAPFAFSIWSRRGERKPDRPGEHTVVSFKGGEKLITDAEREAEKEDGFSVYGEGVAKALAEALRKRGFAIDAPDADDFGWAMHASKDGERGYIRVARMEHEGDVEWLLHIVDPSSGGPGPASFVSHVDEALKSLACFTDVSWQRR
jgi:hypothetical protein